MLSWLPWIEITLMLGQIGRYLLDTPRRDETKFEILKIPQIELMLVLEQIGRYLWDTLYVSV